MSSSKSIDGYVCLFDPADRMVVITLSQPIPLELLLISASQDSASTNSRPRQALVKRNSFERNRGAPANTSTLIVKPDGKGSHWINFMYLGRKYYSLMLWASSPLSHRKWLEVIVKQQQLMRERSMIFDTVTLSESFFAGPNKVNCAAPFGMSLSFSFPFFFFFFFFPRVIAHWVLNRWGSQGGVWDG